MYRTLVAVPGNYVVDGIRYFFWCFYQRPVISFGNGNGILLRGVRNLFFFFVIGAVDDQLITGCKRKKRRSKMPLPSDITC